MIKISVVIPVYNREKCICDTINSVLRQSLREIEVVCVDDGSTDYSLKLIQEIAKQDSRVRVFHQENSGPGIARNNGIKNSVGEYIAFLDSDDNFFDVDTLKDLYNIARRENTNICGGNIVFQFQNEVKRDVRFIFNPGWLSFHEYQFDCMFTRFIYKKSFLVDNSIQFPDLRNYEDPVFLLDAMINARRFYYINRDVYIYNRQHIENVRLNESAAIDGLKGIGRNLKISDINQLKDLHVRTYQYLLSFIYLHIDCLLPSDNSALFYELIQCNNSINVDWLKEADLAISEPILLQPLVTIWNAGNHYLKIRKKLPINWLKNYRGHQGVNINKIKKSLISRRQTHDSQHFETTQYGKAIRALKDSHKGEKCFVIGNGPSLTAEDLNRLQDSGIPTFAMNRVFKFFPQTKWRPTYYISEDILILKDTVPDVEAIPSEITFIPVNLHWYENVDVKGAQYFWMDYNSELKESFGLSLDCAHAVRCRGTVTSTCIQFAVYMGFTEIYLLGIDHNYSKSIDMNGNVVEDKSVKDYFVDNYDTDIKDQVVHDMRAPTLAFCDVEQLSRKLGTFRVFNATRGGKLEVFERVNFDEIIR